MPDADSDSDQADERTVTVTSLANGTLHTFQVRAVNSEGSGIEAEDTATPAAFLVSNANSIVNQGTLGAGGVGEPSNKRAIQFTTGNNPSGYKIDSVQLTILVSGGATPVFSIYSDSSGTPGSQPEDSHQPRHVTDVIRLGRIRRGTIPTQAQHQLLDRP